MTTLRAIHALTVLLERHGVVKIDASDKPVEVSVYASYGTRNFYGATVEAALVVAEHGTRKREVGT